MVLSFLVWYFNMKMQVLKCLLKPFICNKKRQTGTNFHQNILPKAIETGIILLIMDIKESILCTFSKTYKGDPY